MVFRQRVMVKVLFGKRRTFGNLAGRIVGKSFLYALAAAGEAGVTKAIDIIRNQLSVTLARG